MTASCSVHDRAVGSLTHRFTSTVSLCSGPRLCKGRDVHQIVRDDAESHPSVHAVDAMVATTAQTMTTFEHTDAAFAPDAPALPATEPALMFVGAPRRRLDAAARQDDASHAAVGRRLFVTGGTEAAVARSQIRRAPKDRLMPMPASTA